MPGRLWTQDEVTYLVNNWGVLSAKAIGVKLNRGRRAVIVKAAALKLPPGNRGLKTPYTLAREMGYDYQRVVAVVAKLGIKLRAGLGGATDSRTHKTRRFIPDDDVERVEKALAETPDGERVYHPKGKKTGRFDWGTGGKPPACRRCERTDRAHFANGFCGACASHLERRKARAGFQGGTLAFWQHMQTELAAE